MASKAPNLISNANQVPLNANLISNANQLPREIERRFSECSASESVTIRGRPFSVQTDGSNLISNANQVLNNLISNANQVHGYISPLSDPVYLGIISFFLRNRVAYERQLCRTLLSPQHSVRFRIQHLKKLGIIEPIPSSHPAAQDVINFYHAEHRLEKKRMGSFQIAQLQFYGLTSEAEKFYLPLTDAITNALPESTQREIRNFGGALLSKNKEIERERKTRLGEALILLRGQRTNFESGYTFIDGKKVSVRYEVTMKNECRRLGMKERDIEALL